jgi:carboxyl-terminal processing protease
LRGAYQGALKALSDQGIQDSDVQAPAFESGRSDNWDRFLTAYQQLAAKYGKQVGADKLEAGTISQMASSLNDCQTHYFDQQALKAQQNQLSGQQQFGGIGVLMKNMPGHPTVLRVMDGPARAAGMQPGDEIVAVDGKSTSGLTFEQALNSIRGPQGSSVQISVKRPGSTTNLDFTMSRAQVQAPIIDAAILGGSIGYIHLYSFPQGIVDQVDRALAIFDQQNVDSVVFDVRANTGGDQDTLVSALSRFVKGGTVEIQKDRAGTQKTFEVDPSQLWKNPKPLVVLADSDTQSGGEIFAKGMQEEGGYKVIGAPTGGCAAAGHMFDLGDGSAIEISTGKVVSGKGADINHVGIQPDQAVDYPVADLAAGRDPQLTAALQTLQTISPAPRPAGSGASSTGPGASAPASSAAPSNVLKPIGPTNPGTQQPPLPIIK